VNTTGSPGENEHVLATLTRTSVGTTCTGDVDCENPFYSFCQPGGFCGAGVFPDPCDDDSDCRVPNFGCTAGTCSPAPDTGDVCDISQDCSGSNLCSATGSCTPGRAVVLDFATGTLPMGTHVCLSDVNMDGCTFLGPECQTQGMSTLHLHRTITIDGQPGSFTDPNGPACGHGKVVGDENCGPDSVPICS